MLTKPEKDMAQYMHEGHSQTSAYMEAFRPKGDVSRENIAARASRIATKDAFREYFDHLQKQVKDVSNLTAAYRREFVVKNLMREAVDAKNPASVRVRALELVGKMHDVRLFTDAVDAAEAVRDDAEIRRELRSRLQKLGASHFLSNKIKDITPTDSAD